AMLALVVPELAAPMMASTLSEVIRRSALVLARSVFDPPPSSDSAVCTGLPRTPPASLICLMASSAPLIWGGPRAARSPVWGASIPILRMPSTLPRAGAERLVVPVVATFFLLLLQAPSTRATAANAAAPRHQAA